MIIEAQVKDRNVGNGEWSLFTVGKGTVEKISVISEDGIILLNIKMKDSTITFYNCPFFVTSK